MQSEAEENSLNLIISVHSLMVPGAGPNWGVSFLWVLLEATEGEEHRQG